MIHRQFFRFVPPQRWLHNVEHGAVVMLYHPCTHHSIIEELRALVKGCIRKHIITPYARLSEKEPLALVAWGCRMTMSYIDAPAVIEFIRSKGLKGPEGDYAKQGQYTYALLNAAEPPPGSDVNDKILCPNS